jgi:hypothetical protein
MIFYSFFNNFFFLNGSLLVMIKINNLIKKYVISNKLLDFINHLINLTNYAVYFVVSFEIHCNDLLFSF